jgi:Flp pilus assembly protein TadB
MRYIAYTTAGRPSLLQKTVAIVATAALVAVGLMFSAVLFVALLIVLAIGGAYVWWKTREVRRQMKQMHEQVREFQERSTNMQSETFVSETFRGETFEGEIIEGESIRVDTERNKP